MKRILFLAPEYFDYYKLIINVFEDQSFVVDFIPEKSAGGISALISKSRFFSGRQKKSYEDGITSKLNAHSYDYLFVIGGRDISIEFLEYITKNFSFKGKIMYQWDSYKNFDYRKHISYFDVVKTFDKSDADELGIGYLPLFYKKQELDHEVKQDIDLLFIGIWHSDRLDILKAIEKEASQHNLKYVFKIYYPYYMYLYLVYWKKMPLKSDFFIFKPVPFPVTQSYYKRSKCIVDINHPQQTGLTMRTIETLGNGKKLITTNNKIKEEDFYNDTCIQVLDRGNIQINWSFLKNNSDVVDIHKLEITNWIKNII